jgi:ketosteroid isomerase-like protein
VRLAGGFNRGMRLLVSALTVLALACGARRIPGSTIEDTPDTRAIVAVINSYRQAAERRDPQAVLALVSPKYFDDAGTPDPSDDIDYQQLVNRLTADYQKSTALRLDIGVRRVEVRGDRAAAYVFYDEHFRIQTKATEVSKSASDSQRMQLVREDGQWKFVSGL